MSIDWNKPISTKAYEQDDLIVEISNLRPNEEFVEIDMCYSAHAGGFSSADYYDTYCVDKTTGKVLNPFMSDDFSIINDEE